MSPHEPNVGDVPSPCVNVCVRGWGRAWFWLAASCWCALLLSLGVEYVWPKVDSIRWGDPYPWNWVQAVAFIPHFPAIFPGYDHGSKLRGVVTAFYLIVLPLAQWAAIGAAYAVVFVHKKCDATRAANHARFAGAVLAALGAGTAFYGAFLF